MKNNEKLKMTDSYPTKIIQDFDAFLMYIENNKVPLTKASQNMTRKDLRERDTIFMLNKPNGPPSSNQAEYPETHLFAFYMDGKRFSSNSYHSRMDFSGPCADEAKIGELKLYEGKRFLYLFDFGDEWLFDIDVIQITEVKKINKLLLLKV